MRRKITLFLVSLAAVLGLAGVANAESPYKFDQRTDPQCQGPNDQKFCQGSH
jgi:hypothetical protein